MTRALILAAGQGTRLRPLTENLPKCLVHFQGISLLERQVHTLQRAGIDDIHVATGYCGEKIAALGYKTTVNPRFESTNMVETLFCAMDFIKQEGDLIISYGDIIYQYENLKRLLQSNDKIAIMVDKKWRDLWEARLDNPLLDAETLLLDDKGYIKELGKKPNSYQQVQGQYTGLIKIRADFIPELINFYQKLDRSAIYDGNDFYNMYMTSFLQLLINAGWNTKAVMVNNGWLEVDSVDDLASYDKMFESGELKALYELEAF